MKRRLEMEEDKNQVKIQPPKKMRESSVEEPHDGTAVGYKPESSASE